MYEQQNQQLNQFNSDNNITKEELNNIKSEMINIIGNLCNICNSIDNLLKREKPSPVLNYTLSAVPDMHINNQQVPVQMQPMMQQSTAMQSIITTPYGSMSHIDSNQLRNDYNTLKEIANPIYKQYKDLYDAYNKGELCTHEFYGQPQIVNVGDNKVICKLCGKVFATVNIIKNKEDNDNIQKQMHLDDFIEPEETTPEPVSFLDDIKEEEDVNIEEFDKNKFISDEELSQLQSNSDDMEAYRKRVNNKINIILKGVRHYKNNIPRHDILRFTYIIMKQKYIMDLDVSLALALNNSETANSIHTTFDLIMNNKDYRSIFESIIDNILLGQYDNTICSHFSIKETKIFNSEKENEPEDYTRFFPLSKKFKNIANEYGQKNYAVIKTRYNRIINSLGYLLEISYLNHIFNMDRCYQARCTLVKILLDGVIASSGDKYICYSNAFKYNVDYNTLLKYSSVESLNKVYEKAYLRLFNKSKLPVKIKNNLNQAHATLLLLILDDTLFDRYTTNINRLTSLSLPIRYIFFKDLEEFSGNIQGVIPRESFVDNYYDELYKDIYAKIKKYISDHKFNFNIDKLCNSNSMTYTILHKAELDNGITISLTNKYRNIGGTTKSIKRNILYKSSREDLFLFFREVEYMISMDIFDLPTMEFCYKAARGANKIDGSNWIYLK